MQATIAEFPRPPTPDGHAGAIIGDPMPRKPNYRFERSERERQKAAKKAARLAAKQERSQAKAAEADGPAEESPEPSED